MKTTMRTAYAVLAALTLAGCAGNRAGGEGGEFLRVMVENDGTIPTQVRVYLVPRDGPEALVGSLSTLGSETLSTRLREINGTYQLRAEGGTGYALLSPRVTLRGNETIRWDMRQNIIRLGEQ